MSCLSAEQDGPDALGASRPPAGCSTASATTTPRLPGSPTGSPRSATCSPTWPRTSRRTPPAWRPTRPGWPRSPSAGPRCSALTRKYGETIDDVLAWAEHVGRPAARAGRHRRADRRADRARGPSCAAELAEVGAALSAARRGPRRRLGQVVTAELTSLAMPHADPSRSQSTQAEDPPAGSQVGERRPALRPRPGSTTSSCCWPRTAAPSRGRSARARPAASCPG